MATEYGGYMGKILLIDLTTETTEEYPFTDQQRRETLGGKALAYRILADQVTGKESAFSEENLLILSTGPFTGTGAPGSIRFDITALSPKTGLPSSSNCGGSFGLYLKKAGYDAYIRTHIHPPCQELYTCTYSMRVLNLMVILSAGQAHEVLRTGIENMATFQRGILAACNAQTPF